MTTTTIFPALQQYWEFVDEQYDEAGKLPVLGLMLSSALHLHRKGSEFVVIPQARHMKTADYKTDYPIAVVEVSLTHLHISSSTPSIPLHFRGRERSWWYSTK